MNRWASFVIMLVAAAPLPLIRQGQEGYPLVGFTPEFIGESIGLTLGVMTLGIVIGYVFWLPVRMVIGRERVSGPRYFVSTATVIIAMFLLFGHVYWINHPGARVVQSGSQSETPKRAKLNWSTAEKIDVFDAPNWVLVNVLKDAKTGADDSYVYMYPPSIKQDKLGVTVWWKEIYTHFEYITAVLEKFRCKDRSAAFIQFIDYDAHGNIAPHVYQDPQYHNVTPNSGEDLLLNLACRPGLGTLKSAAEAEAAETKEVLDAIDANPTMKTWMEKRPELLRASQKVNAALLAQGTPGYDPAYAAMNWHERMQVLPRLTLEHLGVQAQ